MSIRTLKDGRHVCQYYINGKSKRKYYGRDLAGKQAAQNFDDHLKSHGRIRPYTHQAPMEQSVLFQTLALEYLTVKSKTDLANSTWTAMQYKLSRVILPDLGHLQAHGITHKRLDQYVTKRLTTPRAVTTGSSKKPVIKHLKNPDGSTRYISRSTVHRELCDIQAILNWAVSKHYLIKNPVMGYKKPKLDNAIIKPPTKTETLAILSQSAPHVIRALKLSFFTGLRPGEKELFRLTFNDVDFDKKTIFIISAKKNGIPFRTVPLHKELLADLVTWQKKDKKIDCHHIINFKDKAIKSIKSAFKAAKRRAGITRRIRLYDFRHAAITNMLEQGADLKSVSQIAGHSRTDTTTKIYQHTSTELLRQQIDRLPDLQTPQNDNKIIDFKRIEKRPKKGPWSLNIRDQKDKDNI